MVNARLIGSVSRHCGVAQEEEERKRIVVQKIHQLGLRRSD
jgi:hypothetical protein